MCSTVDQNRGIHKLPRRISMSGAEFRDLARRPRHAILVTLPASRRIKHRAQSRAWVMPSFKLRLVVREGVTGRLSYSIADTLRAGVTRQFSRRPQRLPDGRGCEPCWCFGFGLLRDHAQCRRTNHKEQHHSAGFHNEAPNFKPVRIVRECFALFGIAKKGLLLGRAAPCSASQRARGWRECWRLCG